MFLPLIPSKTTAEIIMISYEYDLLHTAQIKRTIPKRKTANRRHRAIVSSMLGQRRCTDIEPTMAQCLVFAGLFVSYHQKCMKKYILGLITEYHVATDLFYLFLIGFFVILKKM